MRARSLQWLVSLHLWKVTKLMQIKKKKKKNNSCKLSPSSWEVFLFIPSSSSRRNCAFLYLNELSLIFDWAALDSKFLLKRSRCRKDDSASYVRMDKTKKIGHNFNLFHQTAILKFLSCFLTPFQTTNVHGPACGKGLLRLPNIPRNPSPLAHSGFLGR